MKTKYLRHVCLLIKSVVLQLLPLFKSNVLVLETASKPERLPVVVEIDDIAVLLNGVGGGKRVVTDSANSFIQLPHVTSRLNSVCTLNQQFD